MRSRRLLILAAVLIGGLVVLEVVTSGGEESDGPAAPELPSAVLVPPKVTVELPVQQTVTPYLEATGNTASVNTVKLVARVKGFVQEIKYQDGATVKEYGVIAFPEDAARWEQSRWLSSRIRVARPDQAGMFKIRSLPPGDYLVVALDNVDASEDQDPEVLERLRPLATPAKVTEGGTVALTMKLSTRPPP